VLREVAEKYSPHQVAVYVVWLPMVPGDDERAASSTGRMYARQQVRQYYDGERIVGLSYHRDVFPTCLKDAISVMPKDHPLHAQLSEWAETSPAEVPLWDAVLFYPPDVEWSDRTPQPVAWSKQVAFFGPDSGEITGTFFRNDCKGSPIDSDWRSEVHDAMTELTAAKPNP